MAQHIFKRHKNKLPKTAPLRAEKKEEAQAGYTLVELLVVLVILVLIAGLVGPRVLGYLSSSKTKTAKIQIENFSTSLELFKLDTGRYPTEREGLSALVERPSDIKNWNGPYLNKKSIPSDPWERQYRYRYPGKHGVFDLFTFGVDNKQGGSGEDQDVANWL